MMEPVPEFKSWQEVSAYNQAQAAAEIHAVPLQDARRYHLFETERDVLVAMIDARQRRGLTQADLAKQIGCTRKTINRIECGKSSPSLKLVVEIADVLGLGLTLLTQP